MNWLTVQQVARYLQLSTMMVYKLAQSGQLPASKIGRVWRFDQGAIDNWLKSKTLKEEEIPFRKTARESLEDFVKESKKEFGARLSQILIFGSHARGDATPESDIDLLVVLKEPFDYPAIRNRLIDMAYAVTFDKGRMIHLSPALMGEQDFLTGNSPLLLNIRKEAKRAA